jgi:hypothetical protein
VPRSGVLADHAEVEPDVAEFFVEADPHRRQGLHGAAGGEIAQVDDIAPAEAFEQVFDFGAGAGIVGGEEDAADAVELFGMAHQMGAGEVHGLDHPRPGQGALQAFAQSVHDRAVDGGAPVADIDQQLAGQVERHQRRHRVFAMQGIDDPVAMRGCIGMAEDGDAVAVATGMALAEDGVVAEGFEFCGDGGADFTGAEDGDVHGVSPFAELGFSMRERGRGCLGCVRSE